MRTELIVIENDADLAEANEMVAALMKSEAAGDIARLRAQAKLVEDYERRRWPRKAPSVPELLAYLMDQHCMTRADLIPLLGGPGRVSEVLNGKTGLSMMTVRRLRDRFGISADLLIPRGKPHSAVA
jgi:HTH-type transcriptional regulator/antitoxin HigA